MRVDRIDQLAYTKNVELGTYMAKSHTACTAEFIRDFGRYRMLIQKASRPGHQPWMNWRLFCAPDECAEFEHLQVRRCSFAAIFLAYKEVRTVAAARVDPCHDYRNSLLDFTCRLS